VRHREEAPGEKTPSRMEFCDTHEISSARGQAQSKIFGRSRRGNEAEIGAHEPARYLGGYTATYSARFWTAPVRWRFHGQFLWRLEVGCRIFFFVSNLRNDVARDIRQHRLLPAAQGVLVAVSGGVDSMVLLHMLHSFSAEQDWKLTVA